MKVGVITDGKYGERAYNNIKKVFETKWILVPDIPSSVMLDDGIDLNIPECDLYLSTLEYLKSLKIWLKKKKLKILFFKC